MLVTALAVVPAALADPHAFVEHVVLFPLGEGGVGSPAASPLPGRLLATYVPGGSVLAMTALVPSRAAWRCHWWYVRPGPSSRPRAGWRSDRDWRCA
ncbi:hypothetical protein [Streptomyces sp. NPDC057740]|uniref:hypothetical protein n=1 Tax=Streptomyces sp. NPDC057740 TaxID=3346234 RepID=UPI0036BD4149